jgi:biopolymer transport protein ExbD
MRQEMHMGSAIGSPGHAQAEINVTPLIGVLLVVLIILMVVAPLKPIGWEAQVPQPDQDRGYRRD